MFDFDAPDTSKYVHLDRVGQVPLEFDGWLLAQESSHPGVDGPLRWSEVRIWRTVAGMWIVETLGKSTHPGEVTRQRVTVTYDPEGVFDALKHPGSGRVQGNFYDALVEAARHDPGLRPALVERV